MAKYTKLLILSLVQNQAEYNYANAPLPEGAKVIGIKARKTGKTRGNKTLESGVGFDGLVLELKKQQVTIHELPVASIFNRSTQGDCLGYRFTDAIQLTWGDTGTRLISYDPSAVTTGNAVELEVEYEY